MSTFGLQPGITIRSMASAGDWLALFARPDLSDYLTVRVIAWAHVVIEGGQEAFGAIVPAYDIDASLDAIFASTHPRFMGYLGPGQLLSDQFVRERLTRIRAAAGG